MADDQEERAPPPDDQQQHHRHRRPVGTQMPLLLPPPPSLEPMPRASNADSIDESSLLAETEHLLATLDPSAFVRSGSGSHNDAAVSVPIVAVNTLLPVARGRRGFQPSVPQAESSTASNLPPPAPPPVRDKRKEEMQQLRAEAAALEMQLTQLQHQRQSAIRVRDKRQQIWQELVARQCRLRQLAERENRQLKDLLQSMLRIDNPLQLESSLGLPPITGRALSDRLPNYMHGPWYKALPPPQRDADLAAIFEPMLRRLDAGHAEIDAVFNENGLHQELTEPRCYAERKTRRLGQPCHFIELIDVRFLPFPWLAVGNTTWECNKARNLTESDSHVYHCAERPEDSFAVCYRKQHTDTTGGQEPQSMECKLVMRKYTEAHRVVLVCANQIQGENELTGATTSDIGYLSMSNANRLSEPGSPVTVIRCCMHVFSKSDQSEEKLNSLLNLMVSAYEEDVRFVRQQVDTALLMQQQQHALSSESRRTSISAVQEGEDDEEQKGEAADFPTRITFTTREDRTRR
ncbi:hypothetical protein Gpo141_00013739 [Globisporangium polare]